MTKSPADLTLISSEIRGKAVAAVLDVVGVIEVHPPTRGIWKNMLGSPTEPHEALLTHRTTRGLVAELDVSVHDDSNALAVAARVQEAVSRVLAEHGYRVADTTVKITVL